jgi:magnesium transporter
MTQNLNHYEKILSRSHSNYLAQISIEMTDANNQINDVLSKLTALGTVLIPMNLVTGETLVARCTAKIIVDSHAGIWGMNVHVPGQDITIVRVICPVVHDLLINLMQGYTWFCSIIGALVGFGAIGSFVTYRMMVSR